MKSNLQLIFLRVHMEIALLLLFMLLARGLGRASWSGSEQRGLLINAIVSSSKQTTRQLNQRRPKLSHKQQEETGSAESHGVVCCFSQPITALPITPVSLRPANICMALTAFVTDDQDCS